MSDQTLIVDSPEEKKVTELRIAQNKGQPFHEVETRGLIRAGIDYCLCARHFNWSGNRFRGGAKWLLCEL